MNETLSHVYWLGGSPCSGKSSIADLLAAKHGLGVYRCDDAYFRHQTVVSPEAHPVFSRLARASCDELWMRPAAQQVQNALALYREEFALILADLMTQPRSRPLIVEGAALLPELLAELNVARRAIWVVPTAAFQQTHYARREWRHGVLRDCTDRDRAWRNWMARDVGFAKLVTRDARERGFRVLVVDGTLSLDDTALSVEQHYGL